jgi:hypothetical protein
MNAAVTEGWGREEEEEEEGDAGVYLVKANMMTRTYAAAAHCTSRSSRSSGCATCKHSTRNDDAGSTQR